MKIAILILPALAALAFAQEPTVTLPLRVESISTAATKDEVRIDIATSASVEPSVSAAAHDNSVILDLPGVAYEQASKRLVIDKGGVRNVEVSGQQNPPSTRITIRMSRHQPYLVSRNGSRISVQFGAEARKAQARQQQSGPVPAARVGAAGSIDRIFRRAPKPPVYESAQSNRVSPEAAADVAPAPLSSARPPEKPAVDQAPTATAAITPTSNGADSIERPLAMNRTASDSLTAGAETSLKEVGASTAPELPIAAAAPNAAELRVAPAVPNADLRTLFHVKFVQQDVAYLDAGRNAGISEGTKLVVVNADPDGAAPNASLSAVVAELTVIGIAETSAVTQIHVLQRDVVPGDLAYLSETDLRSMVQQQSLSSTRKYPVVISFTEDDDALDDEARAMDVPRPPLPSVNRMQGRIGFDYFGTHSLDSTQANGRDLGVVLRANFTRIGGTYWNFLGYYRGTIDSTSAAAEPTLQQLINRTYHLGLTYDNPTGRWVAGFGRLYLPWANSLDTIDGGYFGRRIYSKVIVGIFAGSTPDPTSWNYNPNRQIGGTFVNISGGSFEGFHYSSTGGVGINLLSWAVDRPFVFFENSVSYKRGFSIYSAVQADSPAGNVAVAAPGPGIGSSLFTMRWSPLQRVQFDFNHTYFRNIPTFDPTLVGTGLLDKYLFQGFSGGVRLEIVKQIAIYSELGRSNRTGDSSMALNDMYGITFGRIPWLEVRADAHYSHFNSSFGSGSYEAASLSRNINERLRLQILAGKQTFISTLAGNQNAQFLTATVENDVGSSLFTQAGFTLYRGQQQNYNQWMLTLGYRFDSKWKRK